MTTLPQYNINNAYKHLPAGEAATRDHSLCPKEAGPLVRGHLKRLDTMIGGVAEGSAGCHSLCRKRESVV